MDLLHNIVYSDQCLGAVHPNLNKNEKKIIKVSTIILVKLMTVTYKLIAMFTFIIGALALKCFFL